MTFFYVFRTFRSQTQFNYTHSLILYTILSPDKGLPEFFLQFLRYRTELLLANLCHSIRSSKQKSFLQINLMRVESGLLDSN